MTSIAAVFFGGGLGACLRWGIVRLCSMTGLESPWAILLVNLIGAFTIGFLLGLSLKELSEQVRLFLFVGLLGGFTTFSTFSADLVTLAERDWGLSLLYLTASVAGGVLILMLGLRLGSIFNHA